MAMLSYETAALVRRFVAVLHSVTVAHKIDVLISDLCMGPWDLGPLLANYRLCSTPTLGAGIAGTRRGVLEHDHDLVASMFGDACGSSGRNGDCCEVCDRTAMSADDRRRKRGGFALQQIAGLAFHILEALHRR